MVKFTLKNKVFYFTCQAIYLPGPILALDFAAKAFVFRITIEEKIRIGALCKLPPIEKTGL
jgi:hypothetical protein